MLRFASMLACAVLFSASAASADQPSSPPIATATSAASPSTGAAASAKPSDPMICRELEPATGSRLGGRRICKHKSEWEDLQRNTRHQMDSRTDGLIDACASFKC